MIAKRTFWLSGLAALVLAFGVAACDITPTEPGAGAACTTHVDCQANAACLSGQCENVAENLAGALTCDADDPCPSGAVCQNGHCLAAEGASPMACAAHVDCPANWACLYGHCVFFEPDATDDADGDGYPAATDCLDSDASVHPGAAEACDGRDNDCDGTVDEGCGEVPCTSDADCSTPCASCTNGQCIVPPCRVCDSDHACPAGFQCVIAAGGCCSSCEPVEVDPEICGDGLDNDRDGLIDEGCGEDDRDADGFPAGEDCDDSDPAIHPAALEVCDGLDNDCDGLIDDGCGEIPCGSDAECGPCAVCMDGLCVMPPCMTCHDDAECAAGEMCQVDAGGCCSACVPAGPQPEICGDGIDNDWDGEVDEGCEPLPCASDADCPDPCAACINGQCAPLPCQECGPNAPCAAGEVCVPSADGCCSGCEPAGPDPEICGDGIDNDFDGLIDEGCGEDDMDGDGFPAGEDCDDRNAAINPAMPESCDNGLDNDCDGLVDEGCGGAPCTSDADCGACAACIDGLCMVPPCMVCSSSAECMAGEVCVVSADGCCSSCEPAGPDQEICGDGIDNDLDGLIDEGCEAEDMDGDGYPAGEDCDDLDAAIHPAAPETCFDDRDNDCDGQIDEGCGAAPCATDADCTDACASCVAGQCVVPPCMTCASDADCPVDHICVATAGGCCSTCEPL